MGTGRNLAAVLSAGASISLAHPSLAVPETPHFAIDEIRVEGTTVLPQDQVEEVVYPFLGPDKTPADIEGARKALEAAYQQAGYPTVSVTVPRQSLHEAHGVFTLAVIERRVGRLRVTGARYFLPSDIRAGAPSLAPGKVPNTHDLQADLLGLNELPDRTVQPTLKPGRSPDTVDVDLQVTDKFPLHGTLELNNRYNADTHALRLSASLTYDNLFQRGDSATLAYSVAPENVADAEITSASYLFHIPASHLSLLLSYLHSNSNVTALGSTDVAGRGTSAGFRVLIPLGTTGGFSHSLSVGWDYKKYYELDTFLKSATATSAPVTYYPLTATYTADWTGDRSETDLTLAAEVGLPRLTPNNQFILRDKNGVIQRNPDGTPIVETPFDNKRYGATPGFTIVRAGLIRQQELPWGMEAWGSLQGQYTNDPLVSSEQIGLGGADSARGYLEAETLGDYGLYLQSELRSPSVAKYLGETPVKSWRFHVFADSGVVANRDVLPKTRSSYGLSSVGVGTRVNLWGYLNGAVQDAQALNSGPDTHAGTNRVLFRLYGEF